MPDELARLVLLILLGAFFVQVTRGTARRWLRAKFLGQAPSPSARARPRHLPAGAPAGALGPIGVR